MVQESKAILSTTPITRRAGMEYAYPPENIKLIAKENRIRRHT